MIISKYSVYPESKQLREWINGVSLHGGAALQTISTQGESLRYFPDTRMANALIESAARIRWLDSFTNGITPKSVRLLYVLWIFYLLVMQMMGVRPGFLI